MDVGDVARAVVYMASLPLDANVLFMTVMATKMPFVGRGDDVGLPPDHWAPAIRSANDPTTRDRATAPTTTNALLPKNAPLTCLTTMISPPRCSSPDFDAPVATIASVASPAPTSRAA